MSKMGMLAEQQALEKIDEMERDYLEVGSIYIVVGVGEMRLRVLPNQWGNVKMETHGGGTYFVGREDLIREATLEDIDTRHVQAKTRGVECRRETCWCRNNTDRDSNV